jgi:hypothetical protein
MEDFVSLPITGDVASTKPGEADLSEEYGLSRFPKRARTSVEKFHLVVLMNFRKK